MENIILIGFMGVGKGSVAREVVNNSEYIAIDTDDLIESMQNRKIKNIFHDEGEPYFRNLEKKSCFMVREQCEKYTYLDRRRILQSGKFK